MIHQTMTWSNDITKAPKGENVVTTQTVMIKGQSVERERSDHVPVKILALTKCGKVVSTYWLLGNQYGAGRWSGLSVGEVPLLWASWPDAVELSATLSAIEAVA